jgi:hypothetical protein
MIHPENVVRSSHSDHVASIRDAQAATPGRVSWRPVGAGMLSVGTLSGHLHAASTAWRGPAIVELATVLTVLSTALFGSQTLSERAFRLLRWLGNRPEPPGPSDQWIVAGRTSRGRPKAKPYGE